MDNTQLFIKNECCKCVHNCVCSCKGDYSQFVGVMKSANAPISVEVELTCRYFAEFREEKKGI